MKSSPGLFYSSANQCTQGDRTVRGTMELIVFDLDGTLLNGNSEISEYTSETLKLLSQKDIAYTVATGRTLHGARSVLEGHRFDLPQAYKNGVMMWDPEQQEYSSSTLLTKAELDDVVTACTEQSLTPFVYTLDDDNRSLLFHPPLQSAADQALIDLFSSANEAEKHDLDELPEDAKIAHINSIGPMEAIKTVANGIEHDPNLVAYSGVAQEGAQWYWLDVHHSDASKGGAITELKKMLGLQRVICFGDSDNDLSMFAAADESYAPENANEAVKAAATAVIGHHDEEGIAHFLRERFKL